MCVDWHQHRWGKRNLELGTKPFGLSSADEGAGEGREGEVWDCPCFVDTENAFA